MRRSAFGGRRFVLGAVIVLVASTALGGANAATPPSGTVSLDDRTLHWQGEHYVVGSTIFVDGGMTLYPRFA